MPKMTRSRNEFPVLRSLGLQACRIRGDGNCLFNALSDQVYGDQNRHAEIRQVTIQHMRENPDQFKPFLTVGAGQRRNPKRKNAGGFSSTFAFARATEAETDAAYEAHLTRMARGGTWGDNIEIQAFAQAYNTDVKIYHADYAYYVKAAPDHTLRPVAHIAHHTWEHYSSIRNINGPMTGLPHVQATVPASQYAEAEGTPSEHTKVDAWKVKAVTGFLPHLIDEAAVIKALQQNDGDINNAVSKLLDAEYISSQSSTPATLSSPGSSSIERDSDSDDDELYPPSKRQNRTIKSDKSILNEDGVLRMEEALAHSRSSVELGTDSDSEAIQVPHKKGSRLIKKVKNLRKVEQDKRVAHQKDTNTSDATNSESELESGHLQSRNSAKKQATVDMSKEIDEDHSHHPVQSTNAEANHALHKTKKEAGGDLGFPSDGEADDEYRPDGGGDSDSDFMPNTGVSTFHSSMPHSQRKNILQSKRVQKNPRKDGKRTKGARKVLGTTIKNFNHARIPSPIDKVVGMKVLFI